MPPDWHRLACSCGESNLLPTDCFSQAPGLSEPMEVKSYSKKWDRGSREKQESGARKHELVQSPRKCKSASLSMSFCWGEGELTANLLHCCNLLCMLTIRLGSSNSHRNFTWLCSASCSPKEACTSFLKAWKGRGKGRSNGARAAVTRRVWTQSLHQSYLHTPSVQSDKTSLSDHTMPYQYAA